MDPNCRFYGHDYGRDWDDKPTKCLRCGALHPSRDHAVGDSAERVWERIKRQRAASTGDEP